MLTNQLAIAMLEQWELANVKPEYQFVVRQYAIGGAFRWCHVA
jgi:hypothetical protein